MKQDHRLNEALQSLGDNDPDRLPDGFMDGVWQRAGEMVEAMNTRRRLALLAAIFVAGLGGGFGTIHAPGRAEPEAQPLFAGSDLSPAVLLHVQS
ncbi:hypothetical protein [Altericroceibacterium spongiae]|nr:hypothetical protein [Altericroceibacterium spongiae]